MNYCLMSKVSATKGDLPSIILMVKKLNRSRLKASTWSIYTI